MSTTRDEQHAPQRKVSGLARRAQALPPPPPLAPPTPVSAPTSEPAELEGSKQAADPAGGRRAARKAAPSATHSSAAGRQNDEAAPKELRRDAGPGQRGASRGRPHRPASSTPSRAAAARADDQTRPVAVYLSADLADAVREAAADSRATLGEWLLDAYEGCFEQLDDVLSGEEEGTVRRSGLPARRRPHRRAVRNPTSMQFSLTGEELAVLDEHQERIGASSRSAFFTGIAQLALGTDS